MKYKKIMLIVMLMVVFSLAIGAVNSTTFVDTCHGGDLNHDTTWEKKIESKSYKGVIEKNGKYYKKYIITYQYGVIGCTHKSHEKYNVMQGKAKDAPYTYANVNSANPEIKYELINSSIKKTGKFYFIKSASQKFGLFSWNLKNLGKDDYLIISYYSPKAIENKNTLFIEAKRPFIESTDNFAEHHQITKAKITFVKKVNGKAYYSTKTFQPNKKGIITYKPKNAYKPYYTEITYLKF